MLAEPEIPGVILAALEGAGDEAHSQLMNKLRTRDRGGYLYSAEDVAWALGVGATTVKVYRRNLDRWRGVQP